MFMCSLYIYCRTSNCVHKCTNQKHSSWHCMDKLIL